MRELNTFGRYLKKRFKTRVYKIPVSVVGFTCPNIDGKVARGGCVYCENESFSPNLANNRSKFTLSLDSLQNPLLDLQLEELDRQYEETKKHFLKDYGIKRYIIYFQSFSNTYAPLETLKKLYERALEKKDVVGISIGTRADCVNDEIFKYLKELSNKKEIWIEFGVQSTNDEVLQKTNRGETYKDIKKAIIRAKEYGINICVHMIFGLPKETPQMMLEGIKEISTLGIDSIKFHPCYVVKNTILANDYMAKKYEPLNEDEYIKTLVEAIKILPPNIKIQRVAAGISNDTLLVPKWCGDDKNTQMKKIKKALLKEGLVY